MADSKKEDSWFGIYWKPAAAVIYLTICVFDFIVVPSYLGLWSEPLKDLILAIKDLPPDSQHIILTLKLATWDPLTLKGGGLFHVAFGAILGATVWSRGQERINEIKQGWNNPNAPVDPYAQQVDPYAQQQQYQPQYQSQPGQMTGMVTPPPTIPAQVNNNVQNSTGQGTGAQIDNPDEQG